MNTLRKILHALVLLTTCSSLAHADARAGLIAHYPFDGNADDASGNGNHGTVNGATLTADRFGITNRAYLFDGVTSFIQVPDTQALRLSGTDYTIATMLSVPTASRTPPSGKEGSPQSQPPMLPTLLLAQGQKVWGETPSPGQYCVPGDEPRR